MVKECTVILNNDCVTVVRFNNMDIQFPAINRDAKTVFVSDEGGRYEIVEKPKRETPNRKKKKTTDLNMNGQPKPAEALKNEDE